MAIADPALRFWLRHVESAGGLHDPAEDTSLVMLPRELQAALDLPEELTVTADPEVAREEGAMLIAPGHPALELAATRVLDAADVGRISLAWPASVPPGADVLLARARDQFPIEHGRIDVIDEPVPVYHPVLKVGVLVGYTVSLDHRFQERVECWVDASTRLEVPEAVRGRLARCAPGPTAARPTTAHQVAGAMTAAHRLIAATAAHREQTLARQLAPVREAELSRTQAYYQEVLAGIARRRRTAAPDRQTLLDARAEATEAERTRRVAEIVEKHLARHEIRPFRLHLLLVPALSLPVHVRRGDRRYPTTLTWLLPASTFAPLQCTSCASGSALIAGKDRLGCHDCMARANPPAPGTHRPQP